ncbi:MAG: sugar-binding domain-containing protein [Rectinemataceae bacterium]|jgi:beta-galactosidase/beta-glucuronidase
MNVTTKTGRAALASPWASLVDPAHPLPEYPRPSLVRAEWLCLNGPWDCAIRAEGEPPASWDGSIIVPFPVESALSGVEKPLGPREVLWYRRSFSLPESWRGRRIMLRFGAVDWEARVGVNGHALGSHRGGYVPFSFDVTDLLREGEDGYQEILVEVRDPGDAGTQCRGKQSSRPRLIWYTGCSGIWGTVWIEPVPEAHIEGVTARVAPGTSTSGGRLLVSAKLSLPEKAPAAHRFRAAATVEGIIVAQAETLADSNTASVELIIPNPEPWSPESPFLYGLSLELDGGDKAESYAALRTVALETDATGRSRVFLNGEPYFNNAVLDQGYWPEGIYTAPTDEALYSDIERAKELGFNAIRKHAKVESERWYRHCDRLGILVWQDIPSGGARWSLLYSWLLGRSGARLRDDRRLGRLGRADPGGRADYEREAAEIYGYLQGFACIVAWVPFNEGWGQFESARVARELESRDPSRLVDAASGWYDRGAGHFASRHDYSRSPRLPKRIGARAPILSEFGGLTLKVAGHSTEDRRQFGYVGASDGEELAARYEALAARLASLSALGLAASVYTQLTDVEIERNGLLTYDRRLIKADAGRIRAANLALSASGYKGLRM